MSCYVYLNVYPNGYMYVGSHTWKGPVGVVDPDYFGSSSRAKQYHWRPSSIQILESAESSKDLLKKEGEYIKYYVSLYGVAPCARRHSWVKKYPVGLMLNEHCNDASAMNSPEVQEKMRAWRQLHAHDAARVSVEKRKLTGSFFTDEARHRSAEINSLRLKDAAEFHSKGGEASKKARREKSQRVYSSTGCVTSKAPLRKNQPVDVYWRGQYMATYPSVRKACYDLQINHSGVTKGLSSCNGVFKYYSLEFRITK